MKIRKLLLSIICAASLSGCGGQVYETYNIGICAKYDFISVNVDVENKTFTIIGVTVSSNSIEKLDKPIILTYVGTKDGLREYTANEEYGPVEVDITIKNGELIGILKINNEVSAKLHGHRGKFETLGQDSTKEYETCIATR